MIRRPRVRSRTTAGVELAAWSAGFLIEGIVAAVPSSPLQPRLAPGAGPRGPFTAIAKLVGLDSIHGSALVAAAVLAVLVAAVAFLFLLRSAWSGRVSLRTVGLLAVASHILVLTLPLLVSRDVYSYAAYGTIAGIHHANPYVQTPGAFPGDPIVALVGPKWLTSPAVYGPMFTTFAGWLVRVVRGIPSQVGAFRSVSALASLATLAVVAWTTRRRAPRRAAFAVAVFGLNPVVLFQSVASGHNDLLVALAVAGAFALVVSGRDSLAVVALSLGTLVKASAALPLLLLLVWIVARRPAGLRLRAAVVNGAIAIGIGLAFALPYLQTQDPTLGMAELAGHEGWLAPSRFLHRLLDAASGHTLGFLARFVFAAALIAVTWSLARRVWRRPRSDIGSAWAWSLLSLTLLGPVLLPWYVTWTLPLAWLLPALPRRALLATSTALAVSQWVAESTRFPAAYDVNVLVGHYVIAPAIVIALALTLVDLRRRLLNGLPLGDLKGDVAARYGDERDHGRADRTREREAEPLEADRDESQGSEAKGG
jgi:hypothetical protein